MVCLILLGSSLSACSYFYSEEGLVKDSSYEYLSAKQGKALQLPPKLHQKRSINYFEVPALGAKAQHFSLGRDIKLKSPVQLLDFRDNIRIKKGATTPTVFINEEKAFIWKAIFKLFEQNRISLSLNEQSNEQFFLKTNWVAVEEKGIWLGIAGSDEVDEFRAKYQVTLTKGELPGEHEVAVERFIAEKVNDDSGLWETVPVSWQDSAEMLNLLIANYDILLIEREAEARKARIAGFEVQLAKDDNDNAALLTSTDIETVWNKLPSVLGSLSFDVYDKDKRAYTYFIKHEAEEEGFFASLFGAEEEKLPLENGEYQVTIITLIEKTGIVFRDGQGAPLDTATLTKLFPTLKQQFLLDQEGN